MKVFARIFKDSTRKKSILTKLHGWDEDTFAGVLFKGQELRKDLTAEGLFDQLGLSRRSLDSRNIYNKLRLFLS